MGKATRLAEKIWLKARKARYSPQGFIRGRLVQSGMRLRSLGTHYGGWTVCEMPELRGSCVISCGAGEDISFDLEMVREYGCQVVIVDPTPRAIQHFSEITHACKSGKKIGINHSTTDFYNLAGLDLSRMFWVDKAIWNTQTKVKFFSPKDSTHVSHSIVNLQNTDEYIEVETLTLQQIMALHRLKNLVLLKLDIEGAEIEVIENMLQSAIYPTQIAVEFDEYHFPDRSTRPRVKRAFSLLEASGYSLAYFDGRCNCLFVRAETLLK
jgi:FkbM family methyltransferase